MRFLSFALTMMGRRDFSFISTARTPIVGINISKLK